MTLKVYTHFFFWLTLIALEGRYVFCKSTVSFQDTVESHELSVNRDAIFTAPTATNDGNAKSNKLKYCKYQASRKKDRKKAWLVCLLTLGSSKAFAPLLVPTTSLTTSTALLGVGKSNDSLEIKSRNDEEKNKEEENGKELLVRDNADFSSNSIDNVDDSTDTNFIINKEVTIPIGKPSAFTESNCFDTSLSDKIINTKITKVMEVCEIKYGEGICLYGRHSTLILFGENNEILILDTNVKQNPMYKMSQEFVGYLKEFDKMRYLSFERDHDKQSLKNFASCNFLSISNTSHSDADIANDFQKIIDTAKDEPENIMISEQLFYFYDKYEHLTHRQLLQLPKALSLKDILKVSEMWVDRYPYYTRVGDGNCQSFSSYIYHKISALDSTSIGLDDVVYDRLDEEFFECIAAQNIGRFLDDKRAQEYLSIIKEWEEKIIEGIIDPQIIKQLEEKLDEIALSIGINLSAI